MSTATITLASVFIAASAATAAVQYVKLRASKRRSKDSVTPEVWRIVLRLSFVSILYGVWILVRGATGSSSAAAWLVTGLMAAIFAWVVGDCGVWLRSRNRARKNV
jgi:hypothetical protein